MHLREQKENIAGHIIRAVHNGDFFTYIRGRRSGKTKMESEYNLHIRTAEGVSASSCRLCPDNSGGTYGVWKDHSHQLVSG